MLIILYFITCFMLVLLGLWLRQPTWVIVFSFFIYSCLCIITELYYRNKIGRQFLIKERFKEINELPRIAIVTHYDGENWDDWHIKLQIFFNFVNIFRNHFAYKCFDPKCKNPLIIKDLEQFSMLLLNKLRDNTILNEMELSKIENTVKIYGYLPLSVLDDEINEKLGKALQLSMKENEDKLYELSAYENCIRYIRYKIDSIIVVDHDCLNSWEKNNHFSDFISDVSVYITHCACSGDKRVPVPHFNWNNKKSLLKSFRNMALFSSNFEYTILFDINKTDRKQENYSKAIGNFYYFTTIDRDFLCKNNFSFYKTGYSLGIKRTLN